MCRAVTCRKCRKTTWSGCGMHVNQVMAGVPRADRCPGHPRTANEGGGLMRRLLGRS